MPKNSNKAVALAVKAAAQKSEQVIIGNSSISQYLAAIGRQGGIKGGKARAAALSPERKAEIAQKAANARWNRAKQ